MKTIMRASSGPVGGFMEYEGMRIQEDLPLDRVKRGLVLVPEGRQILKRMTVYENLLMGAYTRQDQAGGREQMEEIFDRFPF